MSNFFDMSMFYSASILWCVKAQVYSSKSVEQPQYGLFFQNISPRRQTSDMLRRLNTEENAKPLLNDWAPLAPLFPFILSRPAPAPLIY